MIGGPRIALLVIGDGRDRLQLETLRSLATALGGVLGERTPSGFVEAVFVDDRTHRLGFCGAIQEGWRQLREVHRETDFDFVFHLEEDWRFDRALNLADMVEVLRQDPPVCQVALRRGPVNAYEERAGGVVECWPDEYEERKALVENRYRPYLRHALYFTTNPCLYRWHLVRDEDWPDSPRCEEAFTQAMLAKGRRFALWGPRAGTWITHTGNRTGTGY